MSIAKNVEIVTNNITRLREERGWTKMELARRTGIDQSNISRIEKATKHTNLDNLEKIATAFEIELYELFYYRDIEDYSMKEKLELVQSLHPLKQELIETMINAFLKEQEMENTKS